MEKINFMNNQAPYINAENLNQIQTNVENVLSNLVGRNRSNVDLNDFTTTGIYYMGVNLINSPDNSSYFYLLVMSTGGPDLVQLAIKVTDPSTIYVRSRYSSHGSNIWESWNEIG